MGSHEFYSSILDLEMFSMYVSFLIIKCEPYVYFEIHEKC